MSPSSLLADAPSERASARRELLEHPIYTRVDGLESLRVFARSHVFAVWDFMSLLKRLQRALTAVSLPWMPPRDRQLCRFVNEIVLAEESDEDGRGGHASHFELYLDAMREIGADTQPIESFLAGLDAGRPAEEVLAEIDVPDEVREFVLGNLEVAVSGAPHEVAAVFCHGREDVIPDMFSRLIDTLQASNQPCERLMHYLERHVELDGDTHGPIAQRMVVTLCEDDPVKRDEAERAAVWALRARTRLWDGIVRVLPN